MASAVSGQVLKSGKPVKGAIVIREASVQGNEKNHEIQRATTDQDGRVLLPDITRLGIVQSIATWVFKEKYSVEIDGKTYLMSEEGKVGAERFAERWSSHFLNFDGEKLTFSFDIDSQKPDNSAELKPGRRPGADHL
jgi:5-hydroxyisourate hydrolase-like protein (transthyretin family)